MKKTLIIFLLLSLNSLHSYSSQLKSTAAFTENKGQIADSDQKVRNDILFYTNTSNTTVYLKNFGFSYVIANRSKRPDISEVIVAGAERENYSDVFLRIDASFENANQNTIIETENVQTEYSNYYLAHCPQGIKNVMSCKNVLCKNLYNGIDVRYKTNESGFKYDILVKPGANPSQIKIKYDGIENLSIKNEQLLIKSGNEILTENIPRIYQNINGKIIDVKGAYEINGKTVSFRIGNYNKSYELINEPEVKFNLTDEAGIVFESALLKTANAYEKSLGRLPFGLYSWEAKTTFPWRYVLITKASRKASAGSSTTP